MGIRNLHSLDRDETFASITPEQTRAREAREADEQREWWAEYASLPFAEKIRRHGIPLWLFETNHGVRLLVAVAVIIGIAFLFFTG